MILFRGQAVKLYERYSDVNGKIAREVKKGALFEVARGIYETDGHADGRYLAGCIRCPSYLSFEYALFLYDLIPESVYCYTSASYRGGRTKYVKNAFGNFLFRDVPDAAYPWGYFLKEEGVYSYLLAGPEKALCDKLYVMPPVRTYIDLEDALFESLRIEEGDFMALSKSELVNVNIKKGQGSTWNF